MPEERRETARANGAGKVEKSQSKNANSRTLLNSSSPEVSSSEDKGIARLAVDLKDCVLSSPSATSCCLPNGSLGASNVSTKDPEGVTNSVATPSPSSTPPQCPSSTSSVTSNASKPSQTSEKLEEVKGPVEPLTLEPNNNHLPPEQGTREDRRTKEGSPTKSVTDPRSKTATPQEQNCFKSTRRALRSKSSNGSPATYHSSLMGPAQGLYTPTSLAPSQSGYSTAAHYYALYASSQSVPISCQRHEQAVPQFTAYRHPSSQAMNGEAREERLSSTNLFVRPLLESDTKETLIALVAGAVAGGDKAVKSARVTHDRKQHSYGFIDFYQEDNARKALEFLSKDLTIRQTRPGLEVKYARDSEKDDKNVYLSGVPTDFTDKEQLLQLFQPFGAIDSVHIMTNSSGDPTGVAFVRFNATEDAEKAIDAVKCGEVLINGKTVDAKFADRHSAEDKRRRRRQNLPSAATAGIYQNGATGGLSAASAINGYGSMTSAHHALASASPQPHLNMMIPSYHFRYFPTASGPTPFLSSSAPAAAALGGSPSHFVSLHPSAAYSLSGAAQYPAAAAAMLGANNSHASQSAAISAAALNAAAAAAAAYHHPALTSSGSHVGATAATAGATQSAFVHDPAALSAYQAAYYTAAMNGGAGGGYGGVTENGAGGGTGAAYFQPTAAQ